VNDSGVGDMSNSEDEKCVKCADYVEIKFNKRRFHKRNVTVTTKGIQDIYGLVKEFDEQSQNQCLQHYLNATRDVIFLADGKLVITDDSQCMHIETTIGVLRWFFAYLEGISDFSKMHIDDICPAYIAMKRDLASIG
jgi:hypothetical protein